MRSLFDGTNKILKYDFEPITNIASTFEKQLFQLEKVRYIENPNQFYKETAYNKKVDGKYSYYYLFSLLKFKNDIKSTRYLTHGVDFYKGNFQAQMVRGLINFCNLKRNSVILDFFCGSGTTLVEAKLLGFNSIGIDINPIACLNSKVKTELLETSIDYLTSNNRKYFNLNYYNDLSMIEFEDILDMEFKEIFYLFLFTRALSDNYYIGKRKEIAFNENYEAIISLLKTFERIKKSIEIVFGNSKVLYGDNMVHLKDFPSRSINCVITSPPYLDVIDYIENDRTQINFFFNENRIRNLKNKSIGNKIYNDKITQNVFWRRINKLFAEIFRILKPGSFFILVVGFYQNMKSSFIKIAGNNGFIIERTLRREVKHFKKKKTVEYVIFLRKA